MARTVGALTILLALLVTLIFGIWPGGYATQLAAADSGEGVEPTPQVVSEPTSRTVEPKKAASEERTLLKIPLEADIVTIRGRCVDAQSHEPLDGCRIRVAALRQTQRLDETVLLARAGAPWRDPPVVTTSANGRFELKFPPAPWTLKFSAEKPGRVPLAKHLEKIRPGTVIDFGDVPFEFGVMVTGRVIDTSKKPQAGAKVRLSQYRLGSKGNLFHRFFFDANTDAGGHFAIDMPMRAGNCQVFVRNYQVVSPIEFLVSENTAFLEISVQSADEVSAIRGVVLDEMDRPMAGITVRQHNHGAVLSRTDAQGRFLLVRTPKSTMDPIRVSVDIRGFEAELTEATPWGTDTVTLRLRRGIDVPIVVVDGTTGQPVEDYGVRVLRNGAGPSLQHQGDHEDGRLLIPGIRRGKVELRVETRDPSYLHEKHIFEVFDVGTPAQTIRMRRKATRRLQVLRRDGRPVGGTRLELVHPRQPGEPVTPASETGTAADFSWAGRNRLAIRVCTGETNARGEFALSGPAGVDLGLILRGPGHVPKAINMVRLDDGLGPLRVEVVDGARIFGRIGPANLVAELGPRPKTIEQYRQQGREKSLESYSPKIQVGASSEHFPPSKTAVSSGAVRADGTFEVLGIEPGQWPVLLSYYFDDGGGGGGYSPRQETLTTIELRDGESRRLDFDLPHFIPGELQGTVTLNGQPLAMEQIGLSGKGYRSAHTDSQGRIALRLAAGTYHLRVQVTTSKGMWVSFPVDGAIDIRSGELLKRSFALESKRLRIRIFGPDGKTPAQGVELRLSQQGGWQQRKRPRTDSTGTATYEHMLAGTYQLKVWPKSLGNEAARRAHNKKSPGTSRKALLRLGTVIIQPGRAEQEAEFTLPAAAGY